MSESTSKKSSLDVNALYEPSEYSEEDSADEQQSDNNDYDVSSDNDSDPNECSSGITEDIKDESENDIISSSSSNRFKMKPTLENESWKEPYLDAVELESLAFCLRRNTAREKLLKFTYNLKYFSRKLKQIYDKNSLIVNDSTVGSKKRNVENDDDVISDPDEQSVKKPRAIPLDSNESSGENHNQNEPYLDEVCSKLFQPPILKTKDKWVQNIMKSNPMICKSFEISNSCPRQSKCTYLHIYRSNFAAESNKNHAYYTKEDMFHAYKKYLNIVLSKTDIQEKIKNDDLNIPRFSSSFTCPLSKTMYFAQPCYTEDTHNCVKSSQGIWWFSSMKSSKDILSTILIRDLISKDILPKSFHSNDIDVMSKEQMIEKANIMAQQAVTLEISQVRSTFLTPTSLPLFQNPNFAEIDFKFRCSAFNTVSGCPNGPVCTFTHVYFPKTVNKSSFPDKQSLSIAYEKNFQMKMDDSIWDHQNESPFRIASTVGNDMNSWYTCAFHCPKEKTIYYACGGPSGHLNAQNMFLYPSAEDAKLAVAGVVLDAFASRGLYCRNLGD